MKKILSAVKITTLVLFFYSGVFSSQLHVNINDPVYKYLDRLLTQGVLPDYINSTLPLSRDYIAKMLIILSEKKNKLSMVDNKILDEYLANYSYEIEKNYYFQLDIGEYSYHPFKSWKALNKGFRDLTTYSPNQEEHHIAVYQKNDDLIWLDVGGVARYEMTESANRLPYSYHYSLSILLGKHFSVYSDADLYSMIYNDELRGYPNEYKGGYPLYREGFYGYDFEMSFEYANAYIQHSSEIGNIALKAEPLLWGNGKIPIILSDNVPPFTMLSWDKRIGRSRFSFFHGWILPAESDAMINGLIINESKYLVGHRWEIAVTEKFQAGFTEMLVYGGRDPELMYFLPTIFLWPVQHNMTSQSEDNILWFIENQYFPINGLKLYGTFMIDDLNTKEMFGKYYGNRWAGQVGTHLSGNILSYPTDLRLEWTAARPWAYTHRVPLYGTYTHNGRSIGFEHGPNSQLWIIENRWWINARSRFSFLYEQLKRGIKPENTDENAYDFGNNPNEDYSSANPDYHNTTGWIIGNIQTLETFRLLWEYQLSNILGLELGLSYMKEIDKSTHSMSIQINVDY